jgi:hypothetical protein
MLSFEVEDSIRSSRNITQSKPSGQRLAPHPWSLQRPARPRPIHDQPRIPSLLPFPTPNPSSKVSNFAQQLIHGRLRLAVKQAMHNTPARPSTRRWTTANCGFTVQSTHARTPGSRESLLLSQFTVCSVNSWLNCSMDPIPRIPL